MNQCKLEEGMRFISRLDEEVVLFNDFEGGRFEIWTPSFVPSPLSHLVTLEGRKYSFLCADLTLDLAIEKLRTKKRATKHKKLTLWHVFGIAAISSLFAFALIESILK